MLAYNIEKRLTFVNLILIYSGSERTRTSKPLRTHCFRGSSATNCGTLPNVALTTGLEPAYGGFLASWYSIFSLCKQVEEAKRVELLNLSAAGFQDQSTTIVGRLQKWFIVPSEPCCSSLPFPKLINLRPYLRRCMLRV